MMKLKACPNSLNCVSSQTQSFIHQISPLSYQSSQQQAIEKIKQSVLVLPRSTLIKETEQFLQFEFKSRIFGFVDDVDIIVDDREKKIHFRSASRIGYSDFGVNRRRIKTIKKNFLKASSRDEIS